MWEKSFRERYMLSWWSILEYLNQNGRTSANQLKEYFGMSEREWRTRSQRLLNQGWMRRIAKKTNSFELGKRALTFLDDYRINNFLADKNPKFPEAGFNPFLTKSKERATKLKKRWVEMV